MEIMNYKSFGGAVECKSMSTNGYLTSVSTKKGRHSQKQSDSTKIDGNKVWTQSLCPTFKHDRLFSLPIKIKFNQIKIFKLMNMYLLSRNG